MERKLEIMREKLLLVPDEIWEPYRYERCDKAECSHCARKSGHDTAHCEYRTAYAPEKAVLDDIKRWNLDSIELIYRLENRDAIASYIFDKFRPWGAAPLVEEETCRAYCEARNREAERGCRNWRTEHGVPERKTKWRKRAAKGTKWKRKGEGR